MAKAKTVMPKIEMPDVDDVKETVKDSATMIGDDVRKFGRNAYLFGLGAVATADEEVRDLFDRVVHKGEDFETSDRNLIGKATDRAVELGRNVEHRVQDTVTATLKRAGVPSRDEVRTLIERVEELTRKVDALAAR